MYRVSATIGNRQPKGVRQLEKDIEQKLNKQVKKLGGIAFKLTSPGRAGMPDRLVLFPGGRIAFVETKAPGKDLRPLQEKRFKQLQSLGFQVFKIDSIESIGEFLDEIRTS